MKLLKKLFTESNGQNIITPSHVEQEDVNVDASQSISVTIFQDDTSVCPYDQHVRIAQSAKWPSVIPENADWETLQTYFNVFFSNYVEHNWDQDNILRQYFHKMLPDNMKTCSSDTGDMEHMWQDVKVAVHGNGDVRKTTGLSNIIPPDHIHRMQKGDPVWVGDIYSSEMVVEALERAGVCYKPTENYLDFGCSSGSLVRVLKAAYQDSSFYGVDPIESAIEWAQNNLEGATFTVSGENPPLHFEDDMFDGVTAISIWSHFSDFAAHDWFDEMHRIIKPGGWLFFTTHGLNGLIHDLRTKRYEPKRVRAMMEGFLGSDFMFVDTVLAEGQDIMDVSWGDSYFRPDWIMKNISDKWDILFFHQGKNQNHQDLYVLKPKNI